jgi:hypothetical protein
MALTFQPIQLSGSTNGRPIPIAATASPGTLLHTANATALDEVYLYAANTTSAAVMLTVQFGGTTTGDNLVVTSIPANSGPVQLAFGQRLTGGVEVRAFAATANAINMTGVINRITSS